MNSENLSVFHHLDLSRYQNHRRNPSVEVFKVPPCVQSSSSNNNNHNNKSNSKCWNKKLKTTGSLKQSPSIVLKVKETTTGGQEIRGSTIIYHLHHLVHCLVPFQAAFTRYHPTTNQTIHHRRPEGVRTEVFLPRIQEDDPTATTCLLDILSSVLHINKVKVLNTTGLRAQSRDGIPWLGHMEETVTWPQITTTTRATILPHILIIMATKQLYPEDRQHPLLVARGVRLGNKSPMSQQLHPRKKTSPVFNFQIVAARMTVPANA